MRKIITAKTPASNGEVTMVTPSAAISGKSHCGWAGGQLNIAEIA